ncbi:hypothetical protein [Streptomyces europaeiscabiei]|uniref:hypothetical protein n=1 Tax=Streptomyces europaeiscabiei TaxID=146819 RepID=UPI002E0D1BC4|nr:hypothetical protein OHB30_33555 [Streptomyces europaeiscabiei]
MTPAGTPLSPVALRGEDRRSTAAMEAWMYQAARSRQAAVAEWTDQGVALLTAGIAWDAVRVPHAVLAPDLGRDTDPDTLRRLLAELELSGSVFCDPYRPFLYFLVPPGTDQRWPRPLAAGVECLGGTRPYIHHVGVPRLDRLAPPGLYWLTLPQDTGRHADPQHLEQVLRARVAEAAKQDGAPGGPLTSPPPVTAPSTT